MYAELSKSREAWRFDEFLRDILEHGALYPGSRYQLIFEYSRLIRALGEIFGNANMVVRKYDEVAEPSALLKDFMRVIEAVRGPIEGKGLALGSPHLNKRRSFAEVLNGLYEAAASQNPTALSTYAIAQRIGINAADERLGMPFSAMSHAERETIRARFAPDNDAVEAMTGVRIVNREIPAMDPSWAHAEFQRRILDLAYDIWFK
jgi:hypothetical protein